MPAIELARLRFQTAELCDAFSSPERFTYKFHEILGLYNNWALRQGLTAPPKTLMRHYNVPRQVIKQIEADIQPFIVEAPAQALNLVDHLWKDDFLEAREIASYILGQLPLDAPDKITRRIQEWAQPNLDKAALECLFNQGTRRLLIEQPEIWEQIVRTFLAHDEPAVQNLGLKALVSVIENPDYTRIPSLFRLLAPFIQSSHELLQANLSEAIAALVRRTPIETAFFLKQTLITTPGVEIEQLMHHFLPFFNTEIQLALKEAIKKHEAKL